MLLMFDFEISAAFIFSVAYRRAAWLNTTPRGQHSPDYGYRNHRGASLLISMGQDDLAASPRRRDARARPRL